MRPTAMIEPANPARAVALGTVAQLVAKVLHLGLNVATSLALIRYLGPASYGEYVFVLSFCALFGLLSDFGLTKVALRDMSRRPEHSAALLGTSIAARLGLAVVGMLLAQLILLALGTRAELRAAALVASLLYVSDALLSVVAVFQLHLSTQYEALVTVVAQAVETLIVFWLISLSVGLLPIMAAPVAGGLVGVTLAAALARRCFRASVSLDLSALPYLLREAVPVGITLLLAVAYLKLDSVLLGLLAPAEEVGLYGAAYKPLEYVLLASAIIIQPLFTLLSRWHQSDHTRFQSVYRRGSELLIAFTGPIAVVLWLVADPLVSLVYATEFAGAAVLMRLLAGAVVLMALGSWQGFTLLAGGRQRLTLLYDAVGLTLNAVLNLLLIPRFGALGAAYAVVGTSLFVTTCAITATHTVLHATLDVSKLRSLLLACAALGLTLWVPLLLGWHWLIAVALAGVSYPAWLWACRAVTTDEVRGLLRPDGVSGPLAGGRTPAELVAA